MVTADLMHIANHALSRIAHAEIITEPFPHIVVDKFFPDTFFDALIDNFPARSDFQKVSYPGTGHGRKTSRYRGYGLACKDLSNHDYFEVVNSLFASEPFSRALLLKFSQKLPDGSTPIPPEKHEFFKNGAADHTCVFDLQIDFPGYEIPPHPDVKEKIVTFQFFLVQDNSLRDFGTLLCKPKNGRATTTRTRTASATGALVDRIVKALSLRGRLYRRVERSRLGVKFGIGTTRSWLPWELFNVAKIVPALPNHFMAFAPNRSSYHAVRLDVPAENSKQERPVIRGFIRSGKNANNWIQVIEKSPEDPPPAEELS